MDRYTLNLCYSISCQCSMFVQCRNNISSDYRLVPHSSPVNDASPSTITSSTHLPLPFSYLPRIQLNNLLIFPYFFLAHGFASLSRFLLLTLLYRKLFDVKIKHNIINESIKSILQLYSMVYIQFSYTVGFVIHVLIQREYNVCLWNEKKNFVKRHGNEKR